jgi:CHAD domain-containing protein
LHFRRLFSLLESIGIVAGFQNLAVVRNAIQQRGRHLGVAEDLDRCCGSNSVFRECLYDLSSRERDLQPNIKEK